MKKEVYSELRAIFPKPIFLGVTDKQFLKKEISFLKKKHTSNNILDNKILKNIKKEIVLAIHHYFNNVEQTSCDLNFDIFESWIEKGKEKNIHTYQRLQENSFLTGFLYIEATPKTDVIKFVRNSWNAIEPTINGSNVFNSATWEFFVEKKSIVIFPSNLYYSVNQDPNQTLNYIRSEKTKKNILAIGFNVFLTSKTGKVSDLIKELIK